MVVLFGWCEVLSDLFLIVFEIESQNSNQVNSFTFACEVRVLKGGKGVTEVPPPEQRFQWCMFVLAYCALFPFPTHPPSTSDWYSHHHQTRIR